MKFIICFSVAMTLLVSLPAKAGFFDGKTDWSFTAIKEKVMTKIYTFFNWQKDPNDPKSAERAPASESQTGENTKTLPEKRVSPEKTSNMKKMAETIKTAPVAKVKTAPVPFKDKRLVVGRNKIPVFEFKKFKEKVKLTKVNSVPLLDVGTEAELDGQSFQTFQISPLSLIKSEKMEPLTTPEVLSDSKFKEALGEPIVLAKPIEKIEIPVLEAEKKVTADKLAKLVYKIEADSQVTVLPVKIFSEEDLKMLRAMILFEKKDQCHVAAGIFSDLAISEKPEIKNKAHFHLGICLQEMNLPTEAMYHLSKAVKSGMEEYIPQALTSMLDEVQYQNEDNVADVLLDVKDSVIPEKIKNDADYYMAKYLVKKNQPQKALDYAERVPAKHPKYYKAQYLAAVAEYMLKKLDRAIDRQKTIAEELRKKGSDNNILALTELNLGRMAFQKGSFKESLEAFQKVPKGHPLWMQALTEQAWAQIQAKDAAGAIGNMHSIQSPYFDNVFKPESYIVRAIGYLNICQYGDAHKSLGYLEYRYGPWLEKIEEYNKTHNGAQSYQTVLKYLSGKSNLDTDSLPFQFLREAARQRDFLNVQESVNQLIDENGGYQFVRNLIDKDKKTLLAKKVNATTQIAVLKKKIETASSTPGAMKNLNTWKYEIGNFQDFLSVYDFKIQTMNEGMDGLKKLTPKAQGRIANLKDKHRDSAAKLLRGHFLRIAKDLRNNFDNNELLKYEVYAGSGENIRYQVAGGKVGGASKNSANKTPVGQQWDFSGEYWEDEIGNYRSSLKNNCQSVGPQAKKE